MFVVEYLICQYLFVQVIFCFGCGIQVVGMYVDCFYLVVEMVFYLCYWQIVLVVVYVVVDYWEIVGVVFQQVQIVFVFVEQVLFYWCQCQVEIESC